MMSLTAEVASYTVRFYHSNTPSQLPFRSRSIHLHFTENESSPDLYTLNFVAEARNSSTGTIEKQENGLFRGRTIVSIDEYPHYYELLRNEHPLFVQAEFDSEPADILIGDPIPLTAFTLYSGNGDQKS